MGLVYSEHNAPGSKELLGKLGLFLMRYQYIITQKFINFTSTKKRKSYSVQTAACCHENSTYRSALVHQFTGFVSDVSTV
jgi:hypothetical protein